MDYQTPGVYIREVDSGPKPIASVATSIPGFLGLFSLLNFDVAILLPFGCLDSGWNFHGKLLVNTLWPLVVCALLGVVALMASCSKGVIG